MIIHSFESAGKMCDSGRHLLLDNDAIDGVTSFCRLKDVTNTCKCMRRGLSINWREFFSAKAAEDIKLVFIVYCAIKSK